MKATTSYRLELDRLEDSVIRHCHRINAATYDLLVVLREFDQRAGFCAAVLTTVRTGYIGGATSA